MKEKEKVPRLQRCKQLMCGALALIMSASVLLEPASAIAARSLQPTPLEAARISGEELPEGDLIYFGTVSADFDEAESVFSVPIYREGNLDQEATVELHTIDMTASYDKDYKLVYMDAETTNQEQTVLEMYMTAAVEAEAILEEEAEAAELSEEEAEAPAEESEEPAEETEEPTEETETPAEEVEVDTSEGPVAVLYEEEETADTEGKSELAALKEVQTGEPTRELHETEMQDLMENFEEQIVPAAMREMDYSATTTVTFAPGEAEQIITFRILDDDKSESTESFSFMLVDAEGVEIHEDLGTFSANIVDDEPEVRAQMSFSKPRYDSENGEVTLVIERTGAEYVMMTATLLTSEGTAIAGVNYLSKMEEIALAPYQMSKEITMDVTGTGTFSVLLRDIKGGDEGAYTKAEVNIWEEDDQALLLADDQSFDITLDGKTYTVRYTSGAKEGRIYDTNYTPELEIGRYYFSLDDDNGGYFHYDNSFRNGSKPNKLGFYASDYQKDKGYGRIYYCHTTSSKTGEMYAYSDTMIPGVYFQFLTPDWYSVEDYGGWQQFLFKLVDEDGGKKTKYAYDQFDRTCDNGEITLKNIQSGDTNKNYAAWLYAQDDNRATPKSYMRLYGIAGMYKKFTVSVSAAPSMKFRNGSANSTISAPALQVNLNSGAQDPYNKEIRHIYTNTNANISNIVISNSATYVNGTSEKFGKVTGYTMTIDPGASSNRISNIKYPADFISFLNGQIGKSTDCLDYSSSAVKKEIEKVNKKLDTIPADAYFVDWIDHLQKGVVNSGSGYYQVLKFAPVVSYIDVKVEVLAPEKGYPGTFKDSQLAVGKTLTLHAGDTLDLSATTSDPTRYTVMGFEYTTDNGASWIKHEGGSAQLQLMPNKSYKIRPVIAENTNCIEVKFLNGAERYISLQDAIPAEKLLGDKTWSGRYLLNVNSEVKVENASVLDLRFPTPGKLYSLKFICDEDDTYIYRPVITDSMTNKVYKTQKLDIVGRTRATDNLYYVSYEKVKKSDLIDFQINGALVTTFGTIRSEGLELSSLPATGYTVSFPNGQEDVEIVYKEKVDGEDVIIGKEIRTMVQTVVSQTTDDGSYCIHHYYGRVGDRITMVASNAGRNEQIFELVLTDSGELAEDTMHVAQVGSQSLTYPTNIPKVRDLTYTFDKGSSMAQVDVRENSVRIFDDTINITVTVDPKGRELEKAVFTVYTVTGEQTKYEAYADDSNPNVFTISIPKMTENLYSGDRLSVQLVDAEKDSVDLTETYVDSEGNVISSQEIAIEYPVVDSGLVFYVENAVNAPLTFDLEYMEEDAASLMAVGSANIPILGASDAKSNSGLLTFTRTNWTGGTGFTWSINVDALIWGGKTLSVEEKSAGLMQFHNTVDRAEKARYDADKGEKKALQYTAMALADNLMSGTCTNMDATAETLTEIDNQIKSGDAARKKAGKQAAKKQYANLTKDAIINVDILFLLAFDFVYDSENNLYRFCSGSISVGGSGLVSKTLYTVFYGMPIFFNITGTLQADALWGYSTETGRNLITADDFSSTPGNLAQRLESEHIGQFFVAASLKLQVGVGMYGVLSAQGYVMTQCQFDVPVGWTEMTDANGNPVVDKDGDPIKPEYGGVVIAAGGIGIDMLVLNLNYEVIKYTDYFGKNEDVMNEDYELTFLGNMMSLKEMSMWDDNLSRRSVSGAGDDQISVTYPKAGTADMSDFGTVVDLLGMPEEVSRTVLVDNAADRTNPQIVDLGSGAKMVVFNGSRGTGDHNSQALFYSIYRDGQWSTPAMVADDGTFDADATMLAKDGKVLIAWADANRKFTDADTNVDLLNTLGISAAVYDLATNTMSAEITLVDDKFCNMAPQLALDGTKVYCNYLKRDLAAVESNMDLLDFTKTYSTFAYGSYDMATGEVVKDRFVSIKHPVLTDPLVMDYNSVITKIHGKSYMLSTYTVDEDGDLQTGEDRELFLQATDLESSKSYYPASITNDRVPQSTPKLTELGDQVYLTWLDNGYLFNLLDVKEILNALFDTEIVGTAYLDADENDQNWYKKTAEELGMDPADYADTGYDQLAQGKVTIEQANFSHHENQNSSISNYTLATNGDDLYIFYNDFGSSSLESSGVELYGVRYKRASEDATDDEAEKLWGFTKKVQITDYDLVIDEFDLIMNEENKISVVSNHYSQSMINGGQMVYGPNQLVELEFEPKSSLAVVDDYVALPGVLSAGDVEYIEFEVENDGLLTATGFDVTVSQIKGGVETEIYTESRQVNLDAGQTSLVSVPWTIPEDVSDVQIKVVVTEHDVAIDEPAELTVDVPYNVALYMPVVTVDEENGEYYVNAKLQNVGNKDAEAYTAELVLTNSQAEELKTYATIQVPALASGESTELKFALDPSAADFGTMNLLDLTVKVLDEDKVVATGSAYFASNTPVVADINDGADHLTLKRGETGTVTATAAPWNGIAGEAVFTMDDPTVATVDSEGVVTALSVGTTNLNVYYPTYGLSDSIEVTVTSKPTGGVQPVAPERPVEVTNPFIDVVEGTYYYDAVLWAVANGITTGTSETAFSPDLVCDRAQAVTFLWRNAGSPKVENTEMPFTDVAEGAYYYDAVLWAVANGITTGTSSTTFAPNLKVTRSQVVTFQWRAASAPAVETANPFTDVADSAYYADAVLWAVENGITNGTGETTFSPDVDCTRAQIVTLLNRQFGN